MSAVRLIVCLHFGLGILGDVGSYPTTEFSLDTETTVVDIIYETTAASPQMHQDDIDNLDIRTQTPFHNDEETTVLQEITQTQQDVVKELHGIWELSETLDETQGDLKSTLNSIVNLGFARVQVEPDETLDRLKNLLRQLRSRLSPNIEEDENPENARLLRRKRNIVGILGTGFENLVTAASVYKLKIPNEEIASTGTAIPPTISVPPGETTIQKVIHVGDREPDPSLLALPQSGSSTLIQTNLLMSNESGALPSAVTAEIIANAILKILHQNTLPFAESAYVEKVQFDENNPEPEIHETTARPILPEFDSSENEIIQQIQPMPATVDVNIRTTLPWNDTELEALLNGSDDFPVSSETANSQIASSSMAGSSPSGVIHIFDELTASNIMMAPVVFLNGTRESMVQFIQTFNILTFKTKMAILFALSVSILSIALGIYSLGPPIIVVGALGILIPISLLYVLQNQDGTDFKKKSGKKNEQTLKEIDYIIDLIFEAIEKYST